MAVAAATTCVSILALSTNVIEMLNLRDAFLGEPGTPILTATVTARVLDDDTLTPIAGIPDPISLAFAGGLVGDYRGTIPSSASLSVGQRFRAIYTALDSGNTLTLTLQGIVVE